MATTDYTFRAFTPEQAAHYAAHRNRSYPMPMYEAILDYHSGEKHNVYDIGTGPGKVLFDLLPYFGRGFGCDTSEQMIEQAKKDAAKLGVDKMTHFVVCGGEDCADALPQTEVGSIDLLTVAMTAHWLDMPAFYRSAAKALRPGGTLAIWTCSNMYVHPATPNAEKIQKILFDLQKGMLGPHSTPGNVISDLAYKTLPLPWTISGPSGSFHESSFLRKDWDLDGIPSSPPLADGTPGPFLYSEEETLDQFQSALGSASSVVRWRQANPTKAHTEEDAVYVTIKRLKEASDGRESFIFSPSCSLLLMRKE